MFGPQSPPLPGHTSAQTQILPQTTKVISWGERGQGTEVMAGKKVNRVPGNRSVPQVRVRSLDANLGPGHNEDPVTLADAMHFLKLAFAKRLRGRVEPKSSAS